MVKRLFDLVLAITGLVLLAPFFLVIAVLIKIDSAGPVFYLQERVGLNGSLFKLFKFRTMRMSADKGNAITVGQRDPRITSVGYFLRKFKLDELPQLINVVKGDMSHVGPRPELRRFVDLYDDRQRDVLSVRPGITDYASIEFRNENALLEGKEDPVGYYVSDIMPAKLELNQRYIRERSIGVDLKIILKTLFLIFKR